MKKRIATVCYIRDRENKKTLMMLRDRKENDINLGKWVGLGGKLEDNESPEEGIVREVKDESNLVIYPEHLCMLGQYNKFFYNDNGEAEYWTVFVFTTDKFDGELIPDKREGLVMWVDDDKLPKLKMHRNDKDYIEHLDETDLFRYGSYSSNQNGEMFNAHSFTTPKEEAKLANYSQLIKCGLYADYNRDINNGINHSIGPGL